MAITSRRVSLPRVSRQRRKLRPMRPKPACHNRGQHNRLLITHADPPGYIPECCCGTANTTIEHSDGCCGSREVVLFGAGSAMGCCCSKQQLSCSSTTPRTQRESACMNAPLMATRTFFSARMVPAGTACECTEAIPSTRVARRAGLLRAELALHDVSIQYSHSLH